LSALPSSSTSAQPSIGIEIGPRGPGVRIEPNRQPPGQYERRDYQDDRRGYPDNRRYVDPARAQTERQCRGLIARGEYDSVRQCMRDYGY
jgi:hypothetical protein